MTTTSPHNFDAENCTESDATSDAPSCTQCGCPIDNHQPPGLSTLNPYNGSCTSHESCPGYDDTRPLW